MSFTHKILTGAIGLAMLSTAVSPAAARGFGSIGVGSGWGNGWGSVGVSSGWGGGRHWGRHRRGGDDTGEVLAGVLIGAILTGAILSSKAKNRSRSEPSVNYPDTRNPDRSTGQSGERSGTISTEDAAVDACALAAEERVGRSASVRDISNVRSNADGWDVEGVVESRDSYRDRTADKRNFTCTVRYGSVDSVYVEDGRVAMN